MRGPTQNYSQQQDHIKITTILKNRLQWQQKITYESSKNIKNISTYSKITWNWLVANQFRRVLKTSKLTKYTRKHIKNLDDLQTGSEIMIFYIAFSFWCSRNMRFDMLVCTSLTGQKLMWAHWAHGAQAHMCSPIGMWEMQQNYSQQQDHIEITIILKSPTMTTRNCIRIIQKYRNISERT